MSCAKRFARRTPMSRPTRAKSSSSQPAGHGPQELGYPEPELARVPDATVESFAGVANHWRLGRIEPGSVVLDLGCGAGTDLMIAAQMTGPEGRVIGVDMTPAMLEQARASAREMGFEHVELHESLIESLPLDTASVDVVISNGVIDLVPDKDAVFDEIDRVLRPGGRLQVADVVIHDGGLRGRAQADRPLDRLNRRGAARRRARAPAGPAGLHRYQTGRVGRHLRPLGIRGHPSQGREVRRDGLNDPRDQAPLRTSSKRSWCRATRRGLRVARSRRWRARRVGLPTTSRRGRWRVAQ